MASVEAGETCYSSTAERPLLTSLATDKAKREYSSSPSTDPDLEKTHIHLQASDELDLSDIDEAKLVRKIDLRCVSRRISRTWLVPSALPLVLLPLLGRCMLAGVFHVCRAFSAHPVATTALMHWSAKKAGGARDRLVCRSCGEADCSPICSSSIRNVVSVALSDSSHGSLCCISCHSSTAPVSATLRCV